MDVVRLRATEKKQVAAVFARSFFDYPLFRYVFPDRQRRARHLAPYLGFMVNYGLRYGEVYTTPETAGISIWLPPGQTHCTIPRYLRAGLLPVWFRVGVRQWPLGMRADDLLLRVHREGMPGPHWYLWALGVDPDTQGQGIGTSLMRPGLEQADAQRLPSYLETHDEKNIVFYEKRGFRIVRQEQVPAVDLRFWCMVREAHQE
jgi:ribosomal protein S18 acetylase RimI-like enzyme